MCIEFQLKPSNLSKKRRVNLGNSARRYAITRRVLDGSSSVSLYSIERMFVKCLGNLYVL